MIEMHGGERVPVGFELNLFGRLQERATLGPRGFSECIALHQKLKEIALSALPKEVRPSRSEIDSYRASMYFRPQSGSMPEVQLTVRVLHRERYFDPIDDCEIRCAGEIQDSLRALGAQPNAWKGPATPGVVGTAGSEVESPYR